MHTPFQLAARAQRMNPSAIREILKLTERPGIISLAGGLPSSKTFPVEAMRLACERVLQQDGAAALQYSASEGYAPLREWVVQHLKEVGIETDASQVLMTTGSQQGLDLAAKVMIDPGSRVLVESPTYLGALQAFAPYEPVFESVTCDDQGPIPERLPEHGGRFLYLLPNFQNPTGRSMGQARRQALLARVRELGIPLLEDNPYGDLWFTSPPPPALSGQWPEGSIYLGSFSKVLAPGLRLGFMVAPKALYPKLLQAKQAADLHTPIFNQRLVHEVIKDGFLDTHVPMIRALYKANRDAMLLALAQHMPEGIEWNKPDGGMFLWVRLRAGMNATALLTKAVARGVAFVPGAAFYADSPDERTLRLSFVTSTPEQITQAVRVLAETIQESS